MPAVLPPELRAAAQRIGQGIAALGRQIRYIVDKIILPIALFLRNAGIVFGSTFVLLKCISLGAKLYALLQARGAGKAVEVIQAVQETALGVSTDLVESYVIGVCKSASFFLIAFLPKTKRPLITEGIAIAALTYVLCSDPYRVFPQIASQLLSSNPQIFKMFSCIAAAFIPFSAEWVFIMSKWFF